MIDFELARLQYAILNKPLALLAEELNHPLAIMEQIAKDQSWEQYWPTSSASTLDEEDAELGESYVEDQKRRLAIFNVAKEVHLANRYARLEAQIVDCASLLVDQVVEAKDARSLGALFKDLTTNSLTKNLMALSFTEDAQGLPSVIIRDLSGGNS